MQKFFIVGDNLNIVSWSLNVKDIIQFYKIDFIVNPDIDKIDFFLMRDIPIHMFQKGRQAIKSGCFTFLINIIDGS